MRRFAIAVVVVYTFSCTVAALSSSFAPGPFQHRDGALALAPNGNYAEPYFATKALLVSGEAGLDVHDASVAWIKWLLPRQRSDGRFDRYCEANGAWTPCGAADADDSMLAMWIQLLYRTAGDEGLPME